MPKEGRNDKFARVLCESLNPYLGAEYQYIGAPVHGFKRLTSFGYEMVSVEIWGAHAPYRHLEFVLGTWHNSYEAIRIKLGLDPTIQDASHFWQTTGNLRENWGAFASQSGRWDANLNEDSAVIAPLVAPYLLAATQAVFGACSDLVSVRNLLMLGNECPLFTLDPWEEIVLIDAALSDWQHLSEFARRTDSPLCRNRDMELLQKIQDTLGFKLRV